MKVCIDDEGRMGAEAQIALADQIAALKSQLADLHLLLSLSQNYLRDVYLMQGDRYMGGLGHLIRMLDHACPPRPAHLKDPNPDALRLEHRAQEALLRMWMACRSQAGADAWVITPGSNVGLASLESTDTLTRRFLGL